MVPAGNKATRLSSVNHTTKTIYYSSSRHADSLFSIFPGNLLVLTIVSANALTDVKD